MSTAAGEVQPGPKGGNGVSCGSLPIIVFHGLIRKTIAVNVNFERGRPGALVPTGPYDIFWTFPYLLPPTYIDGETWIASVRLGLCMMLANASFRFLCLVHENARDTARTQEI